MCSNGKGRRSVSHYRRVGRFSRAFGGYRPQSYTVRSYFGGASRLWF